MVTWVGISAAAFSTIYNYLGASELIASVFTGITSNKFGIILLIQLTFFILGCFLDDLAILFICMPIFVPIVESFGLDPIWFGILYVVNMQMAFITPPFGFNIFYMKAVAPPEVSLKDIYISAYPFVLCQGLTLLLIILFPNIVLWLPNLLIK